MKKFLPKLQFYLIDLIKKIPLHKILIIQTAFIGDVVLATAVVEKLHQYYPEAQLDFLLRKGNENLLANHPYLNKVLIWDKKTDKYRNLWRLLKQIRKEKYDLVVNLQRFAASGFLAGFSGAKYKVGYKKNPLSYLFDKAFEHPIGKKGDINYKHEVDRNQQLIAEFTDEAPAMPKLYPSAADLKKVEVYKNRNNFQKYITIAPASVWFTKQYPAEKWVAFLDLLSDKNENLQVYLLGGPADEALCREIANKTTYKQIEILAGKLSFLQTAALMRDAAMNFTNDSAPMHFASAMDAPVTAVFCSTIPEFGFGPLSKVSHIAEIEELLACRPCGLHGYKACPLGHFNCAYYIKDEVLLRAI